MPKSYPYRAPPRFYSKISMFPGDFFSPLWGCLIFVFFGFFPCFTATFYAIFF